MGPGIEIQTFERIGIWRTSYYFRIVDCGNSEILAASQRYKTERQRNATANRLAVMMGCNVVEE